jgi:hypothetical protein
MWGGSLKILPSNQYCSWLAMEEGEEGEDTGQRLHAHCQCQVARVTTVNAASLGHHTEREREPAAAPAPKYGAVPSRAGIPFHPRR